MTAPAPPCINCGGQSYSAGFAADRQLALEWYDSPLELGPLGNPRRLGIDRYKIQGVRCTQCGRLDLYAI